MRKLQLDFEKSKEVYEHCKPRVQPKMCYNNVFYVVTEYAPLFVSSEWRVAYGYVKAVENVYCRHCFIVDESSGAVIDPTICSAENPNTDREYFVMKCFEAVDDYFAALESENYMPELDRHLKESGLQARKWAQEQGYIFAG